MEAEKKKKDRLRVERKIERRIRTQHKTDNVNRIRRTHDFRNNKTQGRMAQKIWQLDQRREVERSLMETRKDAAKAALIHKHDHLEATKNYERFHGPGT